MASAFTSYLIAAYDDLMSRYNVAALPHKNKVCGCQVFENRQEFIEKIFKCKKTYAACIYSVEENRLLCGVPIMIGSLEDKRRRGFDVVEQSRELWGSFIICGIPKIYSNFSTLNGLSLHIKETNNKKIVEWFLYVVDPETNKREGLAIQFYGTHVEWRFRDKEYTSEKEYLVPNDKLWYNLLNRTNPFVNINFSPSEYYDLFTIMLITKYNMNDLSNRQILTIVHIFEKIITTAAMMRKKQQQRSLKLLSCFENSNNKFAKIIAKKTNFHNLENILHEGRSNKVRLLLPKVTRASNEAVKHSDRALSFPSDGKNYFCLLNIKDLKSAGEHNVLCANVIMSQETNQMELFNFLKKIKTYEDESSRNTNIASSEQDTFRFVIDGFFTGFSGTWSLAKLIEFKKHFPNITTRYYYEKINNNNKYIYFLTQSAIPIKYSQEHGCCFSPAETLHFGIEYPEADLLSLAAHELRIENICKTPAQKISVALNNQSGSVANVSQRRDNNFHLDLLEHSNGVTSYMETSPEIIQRILDSSIISYNNDTTDFYRHYNYLRERLQLDNTQAVKFTNTSSFMQHLNEQLFPYNLNRNLFRYEMTMLRTKPVFTLKKPTSEFMQQIYRHRQALIDCNENIKPYYHNLRLRVAFGNVYGANLEDGVIVDTRLTDVIPEIHYIANITATFKFGAVKKRKNAHFLALNVPVHPEETLVGLLITQYKPIIKNSNHTFIEPRKVGRHYYFFIFFQPKKNNMYDNIKVTYNEIDTQIIVSIKGNKSVRFGEGSKTASNSGQKNVASVADLRDLCWGIDKYGRKVHAQLVYSDASITGRVASGQISEMCKSDDLAIGPNGEIIAPIDIYLHTIHPYTNCKIFKMKLDTLTNMNAMESQGLNCTSHLLRNELVRNKLEQIISLLKHRLYFLTPNEYNKRKCLTAQSNHQETLKRRLKERNQAKYLSRQFRQDKRRFA